MSRIRILPEILSNKIAAGEVVERPASVVKELVENALDADSSRIAIEVENGGKSLIRVADDGTGMGRDDAMLALERYATSKIYKDDDLFSINTLGFRGEAIPSIASVSRFSLLTREKDAEAGTEIIVNGGKIDRVAEAGAPPGTMITVKQLFFNTPARRKFLKTVATEMGHVADTVASIALAWPKVQFKLSHNGNVLKRWSAAADPVVRVIDVLGDDLRRGLVPISSEMDAVTIKGWIASPAMARSTPRGIYIYVNGRFVRDRVVRHALTAGYGDRLMKGKYPVAVLFLKVPGDRVDVNVHPTKHEVRFADQKIVHDTLAATVARSLYRADRPERDAGTVREPATPFSPKSPSGEDRIRRSDGEILESVEKGGPWFKAQVPSASGKKIRQPGSRFSTDAATGKETPQWEAMRPPDRHADMPQRSLWRPGRFQDARIIGQFHSTYILCESREGLLLVDQHAAHERIVYESLKARKQGSKAAGQRLLVPETFELSFREAEILSGLIEAFDALGLEVEPFGGNTFAVRSVPASLAGGEIRPVIVEVVEKIAQTGFSDHLEQALDATLKIMACHSAIRASQDLNESQMRKLLVQLDACDNPSHCPHGRPTWIQWTLSDLEKAFGRKA